ncbi:MAG: GNAT family acetyltransferase [Marivibrio sp.]|uniref:GNAT family acetyltransferase n=1 Tax=Marivibrio sp. TaxID=2039719 RepID=UPI0032EC9392
MTSAVEVRVIANADRAGVVALWEACGLTRPWNDPAADIDLALKTAGASIFVAEGEAGAIVGAVMTGFDGHRGWLYYLAVDPQRRGEGIGVALIHAAEAHLKRLDCPKVELVLRAENKALQRYYEAAGYHAEPRRLMAKWLIDPPAPQIEEAVDPAAEAALDAADAPTLAVTVTYLEMTEQPRRAPTPAPMLDKPLAVQRLIDPPVDYYRFVQHTIGDPWLWWLRKTLSDAEIAEIIGDVDVEIYVLQLGGAPAGMLELDFRDQARTGDAELKFLGLMPWAIGRGLGPYLLDWGVRCAWEREPRPKRLILDTCTLDHPKALAGYQKAGFRVYDRKVRHDPDPRARGLVPPGVKVLSDVPPLSAKG